MILVSFLIYYGVLTTKVSNEVDNGRTFFVDNVKREKGSTINYRRSEAVRQNGLLPLFPPNVSVISYGVYVFFGYQVMVYEGRFAIDVCIRTAIFNLFRRFFRVVRIVSTCRGAKTNAYSCVCVNGFQVAVPKDVYLIRRDRYSGTCFAYFRYWYDRFVDQWEFYYGLYSNILRRAVGAFIVVSWPRNVFRVDDRSFRAVRGRFFWET